MKKALLLFAVALFIVSCRGPVGPVGPEGPQGYGTNWKIINLVANKTDWKAVLDKDGLNRYYTCHFQMSEINSFVYTDGSVTTYLVDNGVQLPLPSVRHYENSAGKLWTQTTDYDYSVGGLNLYFTNSDFAPIPPSVDMTFRVVLMW